MEPSNASTGNLMESALSPSTEPAAESSHEPKKILLHACCGPCSLEPVRLLIAAGYEPTIYYANSNIHPEEEYRHRLTTLLDWARDEGIPVIEGAYDPFSWEAHVAIPFEMTKSGVVLESATPIETSASAQETQRLQGKQTLQPADNTHEGLPVDSPRAQRCRSCYRLRFEEAAHYAAKHGFPYLGTTLSVSPYQFTEIIREELEAAAKAEGLAAVFEDYRPYYDAATARSRELGMYRQNYCGCRFSSEEAHREREERRKLRDQMKQAKWEAEAPQREAAEKARHARRAERQAYDEKQQRKHFLLKEFKAREKKKHSE